MIVVYTNLFTVVVYATWRVVTLFSDLLHQFFSGFLVWLPNQGVAKWWNFLVQLWYL